MLIISLALGFSILILASLSSLSVKIIAKKSLSSGVISSKLISFIGMGLSIYISSIYVKPLISKDLPTMPSLPHLD